MQMKKVLLLLAFIAGIAGLVSGQGDPNSNNPPGNNPSNSNVNTNNIPKTNTPRLQGLPNANTTTVVEAGADFKNMRTFTQDGQFQIPKGTKLVMIEVWGGGGGGSSTGGGGGGAFVCSVFTIIDGGEVTVKIGQGGKGGTTMAQSGGTTYAQFKGALPTGNANSVSASGGNGATYVVGANPYAEDGFGGQQGGCTNYTIGFNLVAGEDGEVYQDTYGQGGPNNYVVTRSLGKGGNAGNTENTGGRGDIVLNPNNPTYRRSGGPGKLPGGGGGGSTNPRGGFNGAPGMAIIYY